LVTCLTLVSSTHCKAIGIEVIVTTNDQGEFRVTGIEGDVSFVLTPRHVELGEKVAGTYSISPGGELSGLVLSW
jgi:hypothetical protein